FGGGGFPAIRTAPRVSQSQVPVRQMIADWLAANRTFEPGEPSWTVRPGWASSTERPLVDLLVRQKVMDPAEAMALDAARPVTRRAFHTWLTRVMGAKSAPAP